MDKNTYKRFRLGIKPNYKVFLKLLAYFCGMNELPDIKKITSIRKLLHTKAELSGRELKTSRLIKQFLKECQPKMIISGIGGNGVAAVFDSGKAGPVVMLRADMDALPIQETNAFEHVSETKAVAHLCGHDGHSAILLGVAKGLEQYPIFQGKVVLLFQPAEETGEGARAVISSPEWETIKPDYVFALHNLPGFPKGTVVMKQGIFAAASVGLSVHLTGRTAHASQPETGLSPAGALTDLMRALTEMDQRLDKLESCSLITITHAKLGEQAFGTAPGEALLQATLRSFKTEKLVQMKAECESLINTTAQKFGLQSHYEWVEAFPATINDSKSFLVLQQAIAKTGLAHSLLKDAFRWSEDFGHFGSIASSCLFGVGSGENHPALHNPDYDFPDEIIPEAIKVFDAIVRQLCGAALEKV